MAYNIRYIEGKDLNHIQEEWKALQNGEEMTIFQSYHWYQMLLEHYIPNDTKDFESFYALVESDGHPCLIAPLWVVKKTFRFLNRKGVYMLGRESFSDYLNIVYKYFDGAAFDFLLRDLSQKFRAKYFIFENCRENTSVYHHILDNYAIIKDTQSPCVGLNLPNSENEYQKLLSKNSRQNLRTASNRLRKDGRSLTFNYDDQEIDRTLCLAIRESKLSNAYAKVPLIKKYKYRIMNRLRYHFPYFTPISYYIGSKVMTAYDNEGNLRAFFNYGLDTDGTCVRVLAAGTDLDFARYSPGMLLMYNYILNVIEKGIIKEIDFTRGDEKYKYSLGGQLRKNHSIKFNISVPLRFGRK